jgi:LuxR family maltose regulon positive regulatory protein
LNGFKVDFHWPDLGLVVETDGLRYHRTPAQQARDRVRDQAHTAAGLTCLRLTHAQLRFEPEHVRTLHRRASAWHREHGSASEAIHHATAAGDAGDVSELILRHWIEARDMARLETLLAWLDGLPAEAVSGDPRLCLVRATTLQEVGRIAEADRWLEAAALGAADSALLAGPASVASGVAACQAINRYFLGDVGGIADTARPALELEEAGSDYWRSALLTTYGVSVFLGGNGRLASELLDEAVTASKESAHHLALVHALG